MREDPPPAAPVAAPPEAKRPLSERPVWLAALSLAVASLAAAGLMLWATEDPVVVIVGKDGRHDQAAEASCLDCHVPFEGTPSSRCLAPGCHGDLATGTPPRSGPAMPLRFHVALRKQACVRCHGEHETDVIRRFDHALVPAEAQVRCHTCHPGAAVPDHARTDAVSCDLCHGLAAWSGAPMEHGRVAQQPCDLCHRRPESEAHASVAGACGDCHATTSWAPPPGDEAQDAAK